VFIFAIIFAIAATIITKGCEYSNRWEQELATDYKFKAYLRAVDVVEERLKAPSTADFASYNESKVIEKKDNTYIVTSFVDAENSFGAMIRTRFTCKMHYYNESWYCLELEY